MSRRIPPTPVAAPWNGSTADGWLWHLDLERDRLAVAEVDHAGVLARPLEHALALARETLEQERRVLVPAVLRPEQREDGELEVVRVAPQELADTVELPVGETERPVERFRDLAQTTIVSGRDDTTFAPRGPARPRILPGCRRSSDESPRSRSSRPSSPRTTAASARSRSSARRVSARRRCGRRPSGWPANARPSCCSPRRRSPRPGSPSPGSPTCCPPSTLSGSPSCPARSDTPWTSRCSGPRPTAPPSAAWWEPRCSHSFAGWPPIERSCSRSTTSSGSTRRRALRSPLRSGG